jgi:hypothetical protein
MKIKVGDTIATEIANPAIVKFIGKEYIVYVDIDGLEYVSHKDEHFWIPAEIEWEETNENN